MGWDTELSNNILLIETPVKLKWLVSIIFGHWQIMYNKPHLLCDPVFNVCRYSMSRKCNKTFLQMKNSPTTVKTEESKNCILTCSLLNTKYIFDFWNWTDNYAQCVQKILPHFEAKDILPVQYLNSKIYSILISFGELFVYW